MTTIDELARSLGVSAASLRSLGVARNRSAWTFPERDGEGRVIGTAQRFDDGRKLMLRGSKRGLTMAWPISAYAGTSPNDPILVVEGASDAAAGIDLGFVTIGRPSATGGLEHLRKVMPDRHVVVVGENDGGSGRRGAERISQGLCDVAASVRVIFPPEGVKDLREWYTAPAGCDRDALLTLIKKVDAVEPNDRTFGPVLVRLADVEPQPIRWLWPGRIPLGKLTLLVGDPGLGKSLITLDLAAQVSTGRPWPDALSESNLAGGVVLVSAEDDLADMIRPRLDAAGADVERITALQAVRHYEPHTGADVLTPWVLGDVETLKAAIRETPGCRLVVIDPVSAYLGRIDSHRNAEIRGLLAPLADLAARLGVAIVVVTHLRKGEGPAMYRAMGSLAFVAAARAVWAVAKDKDDARRRLMLPVKNNLAADVLGMAYTIEPSGPQGAPCVVWDSKPVDLSVDDMLAADRGDADDGDDVESWLREVLNEGELPAADVLREGRGIGYSAKAIRRAFKAIAARRRREGFGPGGKLYWSLPDGIHGPIGGIDGHCQETGNNGNNGGTDHDGGEL